MEKLTTIFANLKEEDKNHTAGSMRLILILAKINDTRKGDSKIKQHSETVLAAVIKAALSSRKNPEVQAEIQFTKTTLCI